jgi:hypothetical protein
MAAQGPIVPPGAAANGGSPAGNPPEEQGPGPGGGFPAAPGQANPQMEQGLMLIKDIVANARRLGNLYPSATAEVRAIMNAVSRLSQKVAASGPAPEPAAPPV